MLRGLICKTCKKEKHDTAFDFKYKRFLFWEYRILELDLEMCQDCKYPDRWDEVKDYLNKLGIGPERNKK